MILKQLLSGRQFSSLVLIKDNLNHSAHHVLHKIIMDNLEKGNFVHLFNYESPDLTLYDEFLSNRTFFCHNCYQDPWNLNLVGFEREISHSWVSSLSNKEGMLNIVILNSISHALVNLSLNSVCSQLNALKVANDETHRTQVFGVVNTNLTDTDSMEYREIHRLAESFITLGSLPDISLLRVEHRKPFGKLVEEVYNVNLHEEKGFEFSEKSKAVCNSDDIKSSETAPQVLTTFKLTLDDKEKESRRQVVLPYLKNAGGGVGKIIYEPDANDDWDDEDPDDDLEI